MGLFAGGRQRRQEPRGGPDRRDSARDSRVDQLRYGVSGTARLRRSDHRHLRLERWTQVRGGKGVQPELAGRCRQRGGWGRVRPRGCSRELRQELAGRRRHRSPVGGHRRNERRWSNPRTLRSGGRIDRQRRQALPPRKQRRRRHRRSERQLRLAARIELEPGPASEGPASAGPSTLATSGTRPIHSSPPSYTSFFRRANSLISFSRFRRLFAHSPSAEPYLPCSRPGAKSTSPVPRCSVSSDSLPLRALRRACCANRDAGARFEAQQPYV